MKHLIDITQLTNSDVWALIQRAKAFKQTPASFQAQRGIASIVSPGHTAEIPRFARDDVGGGLLNYPDYSQYTVANLFYENSTRTRTSFELAAKKLSMSVVNFHLQNSSEQKGETFQDTMRTLIAMGIQLFVLRHSQDGLPQAVAEMRGAMHVINAGDGQHAHPSQALLDMMTISEQKKQLNTLKIAMVGDLRHSRVSNSFQHICALMNVNELVLVAPELWQPAQVHYGRTTTSLHEGLSNADVVICLRVQRERLGVHEQLDLTTYRRDYALTKEALAWAKKDAMLMHPGPMNRGVEIDSDVADGSQSFILQQVQNGVFMRMAIFDQMVKLDDEK
jgi:aspartate carbamoyltransferase catalytic subunit